MPSSVPEPIGFDPHSAQDPVWHSDARFKVVAAGRRSGKTILAAAKTVRRALKNGSPWRGWWVTPSHDIAETGFELITAALADDVITDTNRSPPREITLANGARIGFRTVGGGANVSVGLDWLVIDEAAKGIPEKAWTQELRPTLSDRDGEALFISTPDGKGWFHDWWQRGQSEDYPAVESWRWSTYDNPHVPDREVDAAKAELPQRIFEQEYLAHFRDDTGGVFSPEPESYQLPDGPEPAKNSTPPYRLGVDLARSEDYLAIIGLGSEGVVSHITRERDLSWPQIQRKIERVAEAHDTPRIAIDATRDNKVVADLEASGLPITPIRFTSQSKQRLIENLAAGLEAGEVTIPTNTMLETELSVFEYETTRAGNVRYGAPDGHHDDTVDALAMAYDLRAGSAETATTARIGGQTNDSELSETALGDAIADFQNVNSGPFS